MSEEINFDLLNLSLPVIIHSYSQEIRKDVFNYLNSLDDNEKKAYEIAFQHLGSSYNICKSNGFKEWYKQQSK